MRHHASRSAAPAAAAEADAQPGEKNAREGFHRRERSAEMKKKGSDELKDHNRYSEYIFRYVLLLHTPGSWYNTCEYNTSLPVRTRQQNSCISRVFNVDVCMACFVCYNTVLTFVVLHGLWVGPDLHAHAVGTIIAPRVRATRSLKTITRIPGSCLEGVMSSWHHQSQITVPNTR